MKENIVGKDIQIPYTIKPCTNSARQFVSYLVLLQPYLYNVKFKGLSNYSYHQTIKKSTKWIKSSSAKTKRIKWV